MNFSLKGLSDDDFKYLTKEFVSKNLELLKQKGVYPYEYMDSFERFNEETLPHKKCFYSSVNDGTTGGNGKKLDGHISNKCYLTCKKNWDEFSMKNMGDYHDHEKKCSVICCLKFYGFDPCHYFSSPGLSWDAMLKMTGVKFKKILDIRMYLFIEKGLRGGISYIAKRYAKANNKYMNDYDPKKPSTFISYLDMNNLYGWAVSEYLPYKEFNWLKNIDEFDVMSISEKSPIGYFLEVDLEYPDKLHVLHNDYPLAPEKLAIPYDMLSDYCKKIADKYEIKVVM